VRASTRNNPQGGGPPFGLALQELDVEEFQNAGLGVVQKRLRLLHVEPQGRGINFDQLILGSQGREREGRFGTRGKHNMTVNGACFRK